MGTISITMTNPALTGTPVTIWSGVTASLSIVLTNATGSDIALTSASYLEIYMPQYFTSAELESMTVSGISPEGWSFSYNSSNLSLLLSWTADTGTWVDGTKVSFTIGTILTSADPNTDTVQVNFNNLTGTDVPMMVSDTLVLTDEPVSGNADLTATLTVATEYGGIVYISTEDSLLTNTLYLNFKNTGTKALYSGSSFWSGTPRVTVSFVYGSTSGSLATDDKQESGEAGSAWDISAAIYVDQTSGWTVQNPSVTDASNSPVWVLEPSSTNQEIIGTGDQANVSFAFSNIISITPIGATQMYVQFSGFMKDDKTAYNDHVFVVGITKTNAPNPGAINIYALDESISVTSSTEDIPIPLTWSMFDVGSVKLSFYMPGVDIEEKSYYYTSAHNALNYDTESPTITGVTTSGLLTVYCWAYAGTDQTALPLNKVECTVPLIFKPVINSFTISNMDTSPPHSYSYLLAWDIEGETSFEIVEDDGSGSPKVLSIPQTETSYVVHPTATTTTYTLNIYGDSSVDS